jgi:ribosomal protein L4
MTEKINNKYRGKMNKSQRDLIKSYAFSLSSNNENLIRENLNSLKDKTVDSLNNLKAKTDNGIILEKIDSVTKKIISEDVEKIDDQKISKFLVVMQLHQELKEALNERK